MRTTVPKTARNAARARGRHDESLHTAYRRRSHACPAKILRDAVPKARSEMPAGETGERRLRLHCGPRGLLGARAPSGIV